MCLKSILKKVLKQNKSKQSYNFSNSAERLTVILQFVSEYEKMHISWANVFLVK